MVCVVLFVFLGERIQRRFFVEEWRIVNGEGR